MTDIDGSRVDTKIPFLQVYLFQWLSRFSSKILYRHSAQIKSVAFVFLQILHSVLAYNA